MSILPVVTLSWLGWMWCLYLHVFDCGHAYLSRSFHSLVSRCWLFGFVCFVFILFSFIFFHTKCMAKRTSPNAFISFFLTFLMFPQNPSPWGKPWSRRSEWESVQRAQGSKPKAFITKPDHCRSGYKSRQRESFPGKITGRLLASLRIILIRKGLRILLRTAFIGFDSSNLAHFNGSIG